MRRRDLLKALGAGAALSLLEACTGAVKKAPKLTISTTASPDAHYADIGHERENLESLVAADQFDNPAEALVRRGYGDNKGMIAKVRGLDGPDDKVSRFDIQMYKVQNGIGMFFPNISAQITLMPEEELFRYISPERAQEIISKVNPRQWRGGTMLYMPGSLKVLDNTAMMQVVKQPKAIDKISFARYESQRNALEDYVRGKKYDRVREFEIFQQGPILDKSLGRDRTIANLKVYTFEDVPGVVALRQDIMQNSFRVTPFYLDPEDAEVIKAVSEEEGPVNKDDVQKISFIDNERWRALRYLEAGALTAGAGALMAGTPVGWILTGTVGLNMYRKLSEFQGVTEFKSEYNLKTPKHFDDSEISDLIDPNIHSRGDGPKVVVPVYGISGSSAIKAGLAVYTFPEPGAYGMGFKPDGALEVSEDYKRLRWSAGNLIQTALIVGPYLYAKNQWDKRDKEVQYKKQKCPDCKPKGSGPVKDDVVPPHRTKPPRYNPNPAPQPEPVPHPNPEPTPPSLSGGQTFGNDAVRPDQVPGAVEGVGSSAVPEIPPPASDVIDYNPNLPTVGADDLCPTGNCGGLKGGGNIN